MLFSNTLKATAAASLVLACAGVNAQSSWKSSQDLGLYVNPTKGISSNVTIGASPTSSLSKTRLTVKSEEGQGGLRIFNSAGDTKLWLNEKGGLSVGSSTSATTNGLLVSGKTQLKANLVVDKDIEANSNISVKKGLTASNAKIKELEADEGSFNDIKLYWKNDEWETVLSFVYFDKVPTIKASTRFECWQDGFLKNVAQVRGPLQFMATEYNFRDGKASIGYSEYSKHSPIATLDVNGNGYFTGNLTCKGQIEVTALNSDAINVNSLNAKDINMDMHGAADYVFDENYNLKSLSEVESYVNENKHLPGMPSAAEMEENGVSVSKMTNLLLEKVEELTLHMIQLEKENAALKAKVESLSK